MPLDTVASSLDPGAHKRKRLGFNLFWRTFFLLAVLLSGSIFAWVQTLRALELEPRTIQTAQQIASLVNLSREALVHADPIARVALIKAMADQERVRIVPREPNDRYEQLDLGTPLGLRLTQELTHRLGPGTVVAQSVNGQEGLWVGFTIGADQNWFLIEPSRYTPAGGKTWLIWVLTAAGLSLAGAAAIAGLINRPLKQLSSATNRLKEGDFAAQLDEDAVTSEIREVNIGFNRMTERLAKLEQDRAVMLAGISHDLRTPLARLRLETEMSVFDDVAREHMVADIVQLDATIDKFLDYARPDTIAKLTPVNVHGVVSSCVYAVQDHQELQIHMDVPRELMVMADEIELSRVLSNVLENARRYGKTPETDYTQVDITVKCSERSVLIQVRDRGRGVLPEQLANLTKPFFRGDTARTAAAGAGLGLSIVDKTVQRMGGKLRMSNATHGTGLVTNIQLQRAPDLPKGKENKRRLHRPQVKRNAPTNFGDL
ncbi:MAG: ATP-binding protein [Comamonas sp.]